MWRTWNQGAVGKLFVVSSLNYSSDTVGQLLGLVQNASCCQKLKVINQLDVKNKKWLRVCIYTASVHRVNRFHMMHLMTRWRQGLYCEFHIKCLNAQMPLLCQWKYELPTNSNMEVGQRSLIAFPFMHYSTPLGPVDLKLLSAGQEFRLNQMMHCKENQQGLYQ